jgi:RimJ/RimL family protein N-acetyltransferase
MGTAGRALVDGGGASRVATELWSDLVALRPADAGDAEVLWTWVNDPAVRQASFRTDPILWDDHVAWLDRRLADPACHIYVAERAGAPWGQVRFDGAGRDREVDVSVAPSARGGRAASALLRAATRRLFDESDAQRVVAAVKADNAPSLAAFRGADFSPDGSGSHSGVVELSYPRSRDGRG